MYDKGKIYIEKLERLWLRILGVILGHCNYRPGIIICAVAVFAVRYCKIGVLVHTRIVS